MYCALSGLCLPLLKGAGNHRIKGAHLVFSSRVLSMLFPSATALPSELLSSFVSPDGGSGLVPGPLCDASVVAGIAVDNVVRHSTEAVRTPGSQSREPACCCLFETLSISFTLRCHCSLSCIHEYLATYSGGYVNE